MLRFLSELNITCPIVLRFALATKLLAGVYWESGSLHGTLENYK